MKPFAELIVAIVVLLAALIGYGFWYGAVSAAGREASALSSSIAAASAQNQAAQKSRSAQSGLAEEEATVGQYFLGNADVVPFLESLQQLGSAAGASVQVESVGAATTENNALAIALHITGPFDAVMRAAGAIEEAPYDLTEQTLQVASDGKDAWHAELQITVGAQSASSTPAKP